jgi:hypothetical protein
MREKSMKKVTRQPFLRALASLTHHRYLRRNNFNINTRTLERLEASVAAQRRFRTENPEQFATASFYGPFRSFEERW